MTTPLSPSTEEVLKPVVYADIFDYPLTFEEIYKFLETNLSQKTTQTLLQQAVDDQQLTQTASFYHLPDRNIIVATRKKRQKIAQQLWIKGSQYGRWIAALPFVRLVAVTGSLAVDNPTHVREDIDYLIVTQPGRLWLCRALMVGLVRYAHFRGSHLCPNYMLTENVLHFEGESLYAAREIVQMVPLYGAETYQRMRAMNRWVNNYLPHGDAPNLSRLETELSGGAKAVKRTAEVIFGGIIGDKLEKLLQTYQMNKHLKRAKQVGASDRVIFTPDQCKGHYDSHGSQTIQAYRQKIMGYESNP